MPQRPDDPSIAHDELLWHRVHPTHIDLDPQTKEPDVSSATFSTRQEVSVTIASESTLTEFLRGYPDHSVIAFTAGAARALGCTVVRDPEPDNPAHALVCGPRSRGRLNKSQQELLTQASRLVLLKKIGGTGAS